MEAKDQKLILDLEPDLQRRVKKAAELRGVTVDQYCYAAISKELASDERNGDVPPKSTQPDSERFRALHKKYFGDRVLSANSVDLIREGREERDRQLAGL